jgi:hypothetical protein
MNQDVHLRYLPDFLEGEMFQTDAVKKIKRYIGY